MQYPKEKGLWYALFMMAFGITKNHQRYQISSRAYERLKSERSTIAKSNRVQNLKNLEKAVQAVKGKRRSSTWNTNATQAWILKKGKGSAMSREELLKVMESSGWSASAAGKLLGWSPQTVASGCKYHGIDYRAEREALKLKTL